MKQSYLILFSILIFLACILFSSFSSGPETIADSPGNYVKSQYHAGISGFGQAIHNLEIIALSLDDNTAAVTDLQKSFDQLRVSYKKIEFFAEYFDPEFIKDYINGPPLKSLERKSPSLSILEPEGMQVLEELIYGEDPYREKAAINKLVQALNDNFHYFKTYQQSIEMADRYIFEASRFQLIRVFSLGITGFDTPMTDNAIKEASISMQSVFEALKPYLPWAKKKHSSMVEKLEKTFRGAVTYLNENEDFETFDRMEFLKGYINPLYRLILDLQLSLGIETYYETAPLAFKHSVNYLAGNLFDESLLNPYYYLKIRKIDDNKALVDLGRTLFFDPVLSGSNERSCASCHQPDKGFTDGNKKSIAMDFKGTVDRNAPTLINAVYADKYFYDLRVGEMENQIEHVIFDKREFHTSYLQMFEKLEQSEEYVTWFKSVFPGWEHEPINKNTFSAAITAYLKSLSGFNSPFDQYVRGETDELPEAVINGFNLFMGKAGCGTCHFAPTFSGLVPPLYHESESEVLGVTLHNLDSIPVIDPDVGRYKGNLKEHANIYKHSFKTTTVRNVSLTAPYMHNGVFETLEEVVEFYDRGGGQGLGLDVEFQTLPPDPLELTDLEKQHLVKFMEVLVDTTAMTTQPVRLPVFENQPELNQRIIGGIY